MVYVQGSRLYTGSFRGSLRIQPSRGFLRQVRVIPPAFYIRAA